MKKIAIINGHPNKDSFNFGIAEAYRSGAIEAGAEVKEIVIRDLHFNPNLQFGYQKRMELEPDLLKAWEVIQWADHLVWIHPVWWGGFPALMKGFIDRLFLPGMAYKYRENSVWWDKLLKGKTAHIITTLDQPGWYYRLFFGRPSVNQLKKSILEYCGVKPVKLTYIGIIRNSKDEQRVQWLRKVKELGKKQK
ncbi:putative NADPH-quinone reductase [Chryseobacterium bernardetii]|jgi:putative NADPH-quinone reductase|uniref:NADPH-quinone reductase n=3 Tax=Chryseobacterium TaxID=59732 RepID=A0ACC6IQV4_9FLAO|nr:MULTISPECIES: NAD(P)H-dependent oxidoreductase [Chryseobacterium]MDR6368917.1 putative NADPH-quinone reductase [Chryseobacterium vietnamense]MDR6440160.1 putative NADPH-quinone reductase [Chryseobacterium bernardetii]MDR6460593.1 putative NADPH-quinone reductase [Chryseobacterium vietnamense]MDR6489184.1 putative NADPH-quinone reductase [Chryseobacterium vietnamense]TQM22528.1 putative NADPH-quinone reductase [Chryseobacterium aquifrigidense]